MEKTELKIPVIGEYVRNVGKLLKVEVIPPPPQPPPKTYYIFEDVEARCELRHNGETIKTMQTLCDFYGIGTGESTAIEEMKDYAKNHAITKDSDLEVVVIRVVRQIRKEIVDGTNYCAKEYYNFDYVNVYPHQRDIPEPTETVVWSSKRDS
jgi:hypothetical protein